MLEDIRKSLVWNGPKDIALIESAVPRPGPGEILVRVRSCAICGSDVRIFHHGNARVQPGQIVGHEIAGEVVAVGIGVVKFFEGDRVAVGADVPCGLCVHCKSDRANCCDTNYAIGHQFEGGFSTYILLNELTVRLGPVHKFKGISFDEAALAEPLACCLNGYEIGLSKPDQTVVIFGAGPIGVMLVALGIVKKAKSIIVIDPNDMRLATATKFGAEHIINPELVDPVKTVLELTGGGGADLIFTACPAVSSHEQGIQMLAKRGVINLFGGLPKSAPPIAIESNFIHYREAYITGSHGSTPVQHAEALAMIESGQIPVAELITHRFSLEDGHKAYAVAASGEAIKVVIQP